MVTAKVRQGACAAFFVLTLVGIFSFFPANAQNPHAKTFGDWKIRCNSATGAPSKCQMFQNVVVKESGRTIMQMIVGYIDDVPSPLGVITLPLGVYLPMGLTYKSIRVRPTRWASRTAVLMAVACASVSKMRCLALSRVAILPTLRHTIWPASRC